jgi:ABC-type multidrug transport system ATPase subunit
MSVKGLFTKFGTTEAVKDISFDVKANEVLALVGHNGAGKSTLLNNMVGMVKMTNGDVYLPDVSL